MGLTFPRIGGKCTDVFHHSWLEGLDNVALIPQTWEVSLSSN